LVFISSVHLSFLIISGVLGSVSLVFCIRFCFIGVFFYYYFGTSCYYWGI